MSPTAQPLLVAGSPAAGDPARRHTVRAPWDGRPLTEVEMAGPAQLDAAMAAAARGFEQTRKMEAWERAAVLDAMVEGLRARREEATQQIVHEAGKPLKFARGEVDRALTTLSLAAIEARRSHGEHVAIDTVEAGSGRTGLVHRVPVGPVAAITPFNFPLNLLAHKVGPAIAAGCSFVAKPAEQTPSSALLLGQLAVDAGYPAEAVNIVPCDRDVADGLVTDPRLAALSFTGSAAVGWKMKARCGKKKVLLELGGNAAAIVFPDADLETAAERLATGSMAYAGQVCISVQRVLCHRDVYAAFLTAFRDALAAVRVGDPSLDDVVAGPMIDEANADRVEAWTAEALDAGARRLLAGSRQGAVLGPSLLVDVPRGTRVYAEEVFGPVVMVEPFDTTDQAIEAVNQSRWGLQTGVFTGRVDTLMACFRQLEVGAVVHDDYPTFRVDAMPYGGVKDSGFGREGLRYAYDELTEPRLLVMRG